MGPLPLPFQHACNLDIWRSPSPISKIGPSSLLTDSVYMVGPTCSNPPILIPGSISDYYGYYWFGTLSDNVELIKDIHHSFFLKVSEFFNSTPSKDNPYRTFILNTASTPSFNNTTLKNSHVFTYDSRITQVENYDLIRRLSHSVVHNFLGPSLLSTPKTQQQISSFKVPNTPSQSTSPSAHPSNSAPGITSPQP
jgi:hypothetical protein